VLRLSQEQSRGRHRAPRAVLGLLVGALVAAVMPAAASVQQPLDPARNIPTACDAIVLPGESPLTRSAKNVEHIANKCGVVGVEVEFQSRRDASGQTRDYVFMSTMSEGLNIYDVTNPQLPLTAGNWTSAGWQFDVQVRGNLGAVSFDGLSNDPSTLSSCLKEYFPGSNDQGDDILRFVYNPAAAALPLVPHFLVENPTCIAVPPGGAHNSTINPTGSWMAISNSSDWSADVVDLRPVTTGENRTNLRSGDLAAQERFPVHRYRLIDGSQATPNRCQGRTQPPGPVTCIVMQRPAAGALGSNPATVQSTRACVADRPDIDVRSNTPCGLWRPHDIFFSRDGRTMYVAANAATWIVDVSNVLERSCLPNPHPAGAVCPPISVRTIAIIPNATGQEQSTSEVIEISHQADVTPDGKILVIGDEKGGGLSNDRCNTEPNTNTSGEIGGLSFWALDEIDGVARSEGASRSNPRKLGFWVYPQPGVGPDPAQEAIDASNTRRGLSMNPRTERGCTVHVFRIGGNGTASPGPIAPGFDGVSRLPSRQLTAGHYGAGVWWVDFSGPPRDPFDEDPRTTWGSTLGWNIMPGADTWSGKEYKGHVYAGDMTRGFDVFRLEGRDGDGGGGEECPSNDDLDSDGLIDVRESLLGTLLGVSDSDHDGVVDGNDDSNENGEDDEDEDDDDDCPDRDSDGDGEDDEDEDDDD
jgi:hypothetical protein